MFFNSFLVFLVLEPMHEPVKADRKVKYFIIYSRLEFVSSLFLIIKDKLKTFNSTLMKNPN